MLKSCLLLNCIIILMDTAISSRTDTVKHDRGPYQLFSFLLGGAGGELNKQAKPEIQETSCTFPPSMEPSCRRIHGMSLSEKVAIAGKQLFCFQRRYLCLPFLAGRDDSACPRPHVHGSTTNLCLLVLIDPSYR